MIKFEHTEVMGWEHAIRGMRNPLNSWNKSDSKSCKELYCHECPLNDVGCLGVDFVIGNNDFALMKNLASAGTSHSKYRRMITVYVDITAPLYWWSEYDTYKVGTVANSCSKMHRLLQNPFEMSHFSFDKLIGYKYEPKQFRPPVDEDLEKWQPITEAKGGYFVSNYGRIKHNDKILSCSVHSDGYIYSTFRHNETGDLIQRPVHRLVGEAFIKKIPNKKYINHIDGNKMNNSVSNLEWCTQSENVKHAIQNNLAPKQVNTYKGKFTVEERNKIKELWDLGTYSKRQLAQLYGVSHTCISDIINDKYKYAVKENVFENVARPLVDTLNELRDAYLNCDNQNEQKKIWYSIIQLLPTSYNQKRTVMLNYEVLANMYATRKDHKLTEWVDFCKWIKTLPYHELITGEENENI